MKLTFWRRSNQSQRINWLIEKRTRGLTEKLRCECGEENNRTDSTAEACNAFIQRRSSVWNIRECGGKKAVRERMCVGLHACVCMRVSLTDGGGNHGETGSGGGASVPECSTGFLSSLFFSSSPTCVFSFFNYRIPINQSINQSMTNRDQKANPLEID